MCRALWWSSVGPSLQATPFIFQLWFDPLTKQKSWLVQLWILKLLSLLYSGAVVFTTAPLVMCFPCISGLQWVEQLPTLLLSTHAGALQCSAGFRVCHTRQKNEGFLQFPALLRVPLNMDSLLALLKNMHSALCQQEPLRNVPNAGCRPNICCEPRPNQNNAPSMSHEEIAKHIAALLDFWDNK